MASSSEMPNQEGEAAMRKQRRGPNFMLMLPLIYAPVLPLIRIGFRHQPVLRNRLFGAVLAGAFVHGAYLMYPIWFLYLFQPLLLLISYPCVYILPLRSFLELYGISLVYKSQLYRNRCSGRSFQ